MVRRDNQGIQIAMIVFILTTLLFMVTTYFGYSSSTNLKGELAQAQTDLTNATNDHRSAESLATMLKEKIGLDPATDDASAQSQVEDAVANRFGSGLPVENQTFLGIIEDRNTRVATLAQQLGSAQQEIQKLRQDAVQASQVSAQKLADAQQREQAAHQQYTDANQRVVDYIAKTDATNRTLVDERNSMKSAHDKAVQDAASQIALADKERLAAINNAKRLRKQLDVTRVDTPDKYDGNVVLVVAATKSVMLDVGRADGVRPKLTFGIFDADDSNVRTATRKATVEVTRVLGDHRCEAVITDTDYSRPIVQDDFIYSPIWSPGQRLGLALVGQMDYDQDGRDDRDYIRNLIVREGGQIDAEEVDGKIQGEMTVDTRYLIVGEGQLEREAKDMLDIAGELAIQQMSVGELLDLLGHSGKARSVSYSGVMRPGDFAPQPRKGFVRESTGSNAFRKRTPTPRRTRPKTY